MAANPFDQFDTVQTANPFDQFDAAPMQAGTGAAAIPGQRSISQAAAPISMRDRIMGIAEMPAVLAGGMAAGVAAPLAAMYGQLTSPAKQGSAEARAAGEAMAAKAREQFYQPRTQTSQQIMGAIAPVMEGLGAIPSVNALQMSQAAGPAIAATRNKLGAVANTPLMFGETPEAQAAALQAKRVADSTRNAPKIEAAQAARKYDIAVNPAEANPTKSNKAKAVLAGNKGLDAQFSLDNVEKFNAAATKEMGLPENTPLTKSAFTEARNLASGPYRAVEQLPVLEAPAEVLSKLAKLKGDESLIGGATSNAEITKLIDDAQTYVSAGMAGNQILKNIRQMRSKAQRTYKANGATPDQIDVADVRMGIANALEDLIDSNIQDPKLLSEFRKARVGMAKTYAYEAATDLNTGNLDPQAIAKITAASNNLTGTIADIGKIAGNFPSVSQGANVSYSALPTLTRSGLGGSIGYALGSTVGMPLQGSIAGAGIGGIAGRIAAKRMGTSEYQAANAVPTDYRPPVNNLRPADINYGPNQMVPYQAPVEILNPGDYFPPNFTTPNQPTFGNRPTVFESQRGLPNEVPNQIYQAQKNAELAQEFRARDERKPAGRGVDLVFDSAGNLVEVPVAGAGGVIGVPTALESAVAKIAGQMQAETNTKFSTRKTTGGKIVKTEDQFSDVFPGEAIISRTGPKYNTTGKVTVGESTREPSLFNLTAEERIAWNKTRADLAEIMPELKKLSDREITRRMADVKLSEEMVAKAREKAAMFDDLSKRIAGDQAKRDAAVKREQMLDLLANLEDQFSKSRPVKKGTQGPKTRAAQRNMLIPEERRIILNNMLPDQP